MKNLFISLITAFAFGSVHAAEPAKAPAPAKAASAPAKPAAKPAEAKPAPKAEAKPAQKWHRQCTSARCANTSMTSQLMALGNHYPSTGIVPSVVALRMSTTKYILIENHGSHSTVWRYSRRILNLGLWSTRICCSNWNLGSTWVLTITYLRPY